MMNQTERLQQNIETAGDSIQNALLVAKEAGTSGDVNDLNATIKIMMDYCSNALKELGLWTEGHELGNSWNDELKKMREDAGLTQEEAAKQLNCSIENYRAYEAGERMPCDEMIARALGMFNGQGSSNKLINKVYRARKLNREVGKHD